jgi:hypothetical protein
VVMADGVRFTFVGPLATPPAISTQPQGRLVAAGSNVMFGVVASGSPAPAYQWRLNGTNIAGATADSYTRFDAQPADSGEYSVVVTNLAGTVLSSNAPLEVVAPVPGQFQLIERQANGRVYLVWSGHPLFAYTLQGSSNLLFWSDVANVQSTNTTFDYLDVSATNEARQFYRTRN